MPFSIDHSFSEKRMSLSEPEEGERDRVTAVVPAAGFSRRFGEEDKLLAEIDGEPLILRTMRPVVASDLYSTIVVTRQRDDRLRQVVLEELGDPPDLRFLMNKHPENGFLSSLKRGMRIVPPEASAVAVVLADTPLLRAGVIDRVIDAYREKGGIVVPAAGGADRHPRVLPRRLFGEFYDLPDGESGKQVLDDHAEEIHRVEFEDAGPFLDVDTVEDLSRARELLNK